MATTWSFGNSSGIVARAKSYKAPKSVIALACVACIAATVAIGFTWGGWVTGRSAAAMADQAAIRGQANLAAAICVDRFITGPDAKAQTALLVSAEFWRRSDLIRQGGWLVLPGRTDPVAGAAELCVQQILRTSAKSD